jgi:hypothetical protein
MGERGLASMNQTIALMSEKVVHQIYQNIYLDYLHKMVRNERYDT